MKFYHNKSFGYPVLQTLNLGVEAPALPNLMSEEAYASETDYRGGKFKASVKLGLDLEPPYPVCCAYDFTTSVQGLQEAVEDEKAAYFLRIQCPNTYFSQVEQVPQKGKLCIPRNKLRGDVEITAFIVAVKDAAIESNQIHSDFDTKKFDVKAGMVLAHQAPIPYNLDHIMDYFRTIRSVMEYRADSKIKKGEFAINVQSLDLGVVRVVAHPDQIKLFADAEKSGEKGTILLNSVLFVAVMQMFRELINEPANYENTRWAKALKKQYNGDINKEMDVVKATQTILNQPLGLLNERFFSPPKHKRN